MRPETGKKYSDFPSALENEDASQSQFYSGVIDMSRYDFATADRRPAKTGSTNKVAIHETPLNVKLNTKAEIIGIVTSSCPIFT